MRLRPPGERWWKRLDFNVSVHEFLGLMSYPVDDKKIKIVQFWLMRAVGGPVREPMYDIKAVKWLSLTTTLALVHRQGFFADFPDRRSGPCHGNRTGPASIRGVCAFIRIALSALGIDSIGVNVSVLGLWRRGVTVCCFARI